MQRLLIIAGGTGGHIFPAMVVAETLQKQGVSIEWIGTETGMERKLVAHHVPIYFLPVSALRGKGWRTQLLAPFRLLRAVFLAYRLIRKINPDVILGMGGYASGPGGIAAWLLRKPLVIHEQNAVAGLTNRLLSRIATTVLQAFPNAFSKKINAITVGNPVRESITHISRPENYFQTRKKPWRILVLGGSQGSLAINQQVMHWLSSCEDRESFLIWHQTGQKDYESLQKSYQAYLGSIYRVAPFIETMSEAYAWSDLVICRSGALTVSELAAAGLPSVLIPYPYAVDDHQYANAQFLERAGAAVIFRESELSAEKLNAFLENLLSSPKRLQVMAEKARICAQPEAVLKIIAAIREVGVGV
ncbi:MAG: undecaprenyldiphospho-muramoylpentapeptide beta-N-acetylglucosaminyltransferase [Gammaproteobacteria bacterium RIFCSPHIGHO2_12_FULL_40_19]|nr:MAG: undecaprenyldiphospho-muramoylpentapeptide beta-N-acetylglucosaminyltransferase [Gammaproteobacteria bacterium RIFCSPHIGHO2_12_FULL_40_19]